MSDDDTAQPLRIGAAADLLRIPAAAADLAAVERSGNSLEIW